MSLQDIEFERINTQLFDKYRRFRRICADTRSTNDNDCVGAFSALNAATPARDQRTLRARAARRACRRASRDEFVLGLFQFTPTSLQIENEIICQRIEDARIHARTTTHAPQMKTQLPRNAHKKHNHCVGG
jgi:predicted deacylase